MTSSRCPQTDVCGGLVPIPSKLGLSPLRLYGFRLYHQVEDIDVGRCAVSGCGALELLDPQYIAYAFAMCEGLDIDGQRFPFAR